jgi:hypothetical protein
MRAINKYWVIVLFALFQFQCGRGLSPRNYMRHFEKNRVKYCQTIKHNGIAAKVCYMPTEYYAARDMMSENKLSLDSAIKRYRNSMYFAISITGDNYKSGSALLQRDKGMQGFSNNVMRTTFQTEGNLFLLSGQDTIRPANFTYERNWGVGNEDVFFASFSRKELNKPYSAYHLIFRDIAPELGTVDIALKELIRNNKKLKG